MLPKERREVLLAVNTLTKEGKAATVDRIIVETGAHNRDALLAVINPMIRDNFLTLKGASTLLLTAKGHSFLSSNESVSFRSNSETDDNPMPPDSYFPKILFDTLERARRAVPVIDYALGAVGIGAAGAILLALFYGSGQLTVVAVAGTFIASILLFIFALFAGSGNKSVVFAGAIIIWAVVIFFCVFLLFTITAVAFDWPHQWSLFLGLHRS